MIIKNEQIENDSVGNFTKIVSRIENKNLGLALKMVSSSLYSNPIGSFIRELTSNAVDAHTMANNPDPVLVRLFELRPDEWYLEIIDKGVGMSAKFFDENFMSWFESEKRTTDDTIGGWGLGSKSGLAYTDSYEICTIKDGVKNTFLLYNDDIPSAEPLSSIETDEPNGTRVLIPIESKDLLKVSTELKNQLAYFKGVYVVDEYRYYNNDFKLNEYEDFILSSEPFAYNMHIVLGQVTYPIDWVKLEISPIRIPVALKFNVGELPVTLSRESIDYKSDEVINTIKDRVKKVEEYIVNLYSENLAFDDILEFIKFTDNRDRTFELNGVSIDLSHYDIKASFTPFGDLKITKKHISRLFSLYLPKEISNGEVVDTYLSPQQILRYDYYVSRKHSSSWDALYVNNSNLLRRRKLSKQVVKSLASVFGLLKDGKPVVGALLKISVVIKYIDAFVHSRAIGSLDGIATEEWIEAYKAERREEEQLRRQNITSYRIFNGYSRNTNHLGELIDKYKTIFYFDIKGDDIKKSLAYYSVYDSLPHHYKKNSTVLFVTSTSAKRLSRTKRCFHISTIGELKFLHNYFHRLILSKRLQSSFSILNTLYLSDYSKYYSYRLNILKNMYSLNYNFYYYDIRDYSEPTSYEAYTLKSFKLDLTEEFKADIEAMKLTKHRDQLPYEEYFDELDALEPKIKDLRYITSNPPSYVVYRVLKGRNIKHLNIKFYKDEQH